MATINEQIHSKDALVIWDLCHSVGAVPMHLNQTDSDFAIGCTYKYLNGGPGSPALLWVNEKHRDQFWQPLSGWWSHKNHLIWHSIMSQRIVSADIYVGLSRLFL